MITPGNVLPPDDSDNAEADDQQSQKDIHSNGFDELPHPGEVDDSASPSNLEEAYRASESAYTLDLDDEDE